MKLARLTSLVVSLLTVTGLLVAVGGSASASATCTSISLSPSKSKVRKGSSVKLTGVGCPGDAISVQTKKSGTWQVVAQQAPAADGSFGVCTRPRPPRGKKTASFRAIGPSSQSGVVSIKVSTSGTSTGCPTDSTGGGSTGGGSTSPPPTPPPPPPPPPSSCPLATAGSSIGLTVADCQTLWSDSAQSSDPTPQWGTIECATASRHQWNSSGGDTHLAAAGQSQGNSAYRRLTVLDGDDFYGERCELGKNDHRDGPTALYREGQRRATFMSVRLPDNLPLDGNAWQVIMQMKQSQPSANGGGTPVIELDAYGGRWHLMQSDSSGPSSDSRELWSAPAAKNAWTRFAFDIVYSQDPSVGSVTVHSDLNGDGDSADAGEESSTIHTYTLKVETSGGSSTDGIAPGESIPSHLRAGIYHNPSIACPGSSGCSVDLDNVQIVAP